MESAEYEIRLKDAFSQGLGRLENKMNQFETKVTGLGSTLASVFGGVTLAGAVSTGLSFINQTAQAIVGLGADMQQTRISFETMLGSADKANALISDLQKFSSATPFSQKEVITGAKSLLAYGFAANDLTKDLTTLGDVSAGLSIPINDLIYLYGTLKTQGKAMSKDLIQFAGRGIPIYKELGKVLGVSTEEVSDLVSKGKVGFDQVAKAFQNMTAKGSMFGGLMEKQSRSLAGQWSTFKDTLEILGTKMGESLIEPLGKVVSFMSDAVALIPKFDFSPITDVFRDMFAPINDIINLFREMFGMMGTNIGLFDIFQALAKSLGLTFRAVTTGMMVFYTGYKILIQAVRDSFMIWQGLGELIKGVFTLDQTKIFGGINKMKLGFKELASNAKDEVLDFGKDQFNAYKKIFTTWGNPSNQDASKAGSGTNGTAGSRSSSGLGGLAAKASAIGVERIQSGSRNVVVNINKLIEHITFEKGYKESEAKMQEMVSRALLASVNDVNLVTQ